MSEYYRLYDSVYAHKLKQAFEKGITVTKEIEDTLNKFELERYDIKSFGFKNDKFIYTNGAGEEKFISAISKGEQSLRNMKLGAM